MGIKGDVRSISLANVLQDLVTNEQTGTLAIKPKKERQQLYLWFDKGALKLVGLGERQGPSLLNGLLALEKIRPDETPSVTARPTSEGGFIRGLLKKGRVSREDLKAALEHQMGEHLCDAFLWADATFEFEEGDPDDRAFDVDQLDLEPRLAVEAAIMEAVRRADEWGETRKAILSSNEILVPDASRLSPEVEGMVRRIFSMLDGERTLRQIQEMTRLGHFMLLRAAAILMRSGAARPLSAAESFERARARAGRKEWDAALRMARYGLDHERKNMGLLELALRCTEELQDHEGAASYARQLASAQVESAAFETAIKTYQKVLVHAPRDLTAHERLFAILLQLDLKLDALAAGEGLAAAYKKAGLPDKALAVYTQLLEKMGENKELLESVAEIQRHLGDKSEAVKTYRRLLDRAMEEKNDAAALDYCRTILKLDPRNEDALGLRQQLESGEIEKARRRRRLVRTVTGATLTAGLIASAIVYELRARDVYGLIRLPLRQAVGDNKYADALRLYDQVIDPYRWSLKARELRPEREEDESRYITTAMASVDELERKGLLTEAIVLLQEARLLVRASDHRGAMQERLRKLHDDRDNEERKWNKKLEQMDPKEIGLVTNPLAVPALVRLLDSDKSIQRVAAVTALGAMDGEAAVSGLVKALADSEPMVTTQAAAHLVRRERTPFLASLSGPSSVKAGESLPVEWRVTNLSPAEVELTLEEPAHQRLKMSGPNGSVSVSFPSGVGRRTVRLGPGEFVGGAFPKLTLNMAVSGRYQVAWSAALSWGGRAVQLAAAPVAIDRR